MTNTSPDPTIARRARAARRVADQLAGNDRWRAQIRAALAALEAIPHEPFDFIAVEIARMNDLLTEADADLDDIIERAIVNDDLTPEDIEAVTR